MPLHRKGLPALGLGDLAALDAAGAHANALGRAVDQGLDGLQINVPAAAGHVVRVRDVVTELRTLAANIAYLCHDVLLQILYGFARPLPLARELSARLAHPTRLSLGAGQAGAFHETHCPAAAESPV